MAHNSKDYQEHASIEELLQEDCDMENSSAMESPKDVNSQDYPNIVIRKITRKGATNFRKKKRSMTKHKIKSKSKCFCKGCQTDPCGICTNCRDKKSNGGKSTKRQRCQKRICLEKGKRESKHTNKGDGDSQQNGDKEYLKIPIPQVEENFNATVHINENEKGGRGHKRYVFQYEEKIDFMVSQLQEKLSEKEIKCRKCDKVFVNEKWQCQQYQSLKNHIETHLTNFTHCCPKCSFETHTRSNMIDHLSRHRKKDV